MIGTGPIDTLRFDTLNIGNGAGSALPPGAADQRLNAGIAQRFGRRAPHDRNAEPFKQDLLELARSESGSLLLRREIFDLTDVATSVVNTFAQRSIAAVKP